MGDAPAEGELSEPSDSEDRFAADLLSLKDASGLSFVRLAKKAGMSKTSVNNATHSSSGLASEAVVRAMVMQLAPDRVAEFVARRNRLAGRPESDPAQEAPQDRSSTAVRARLPAVGLVAAAMLVIAVSAFYLGRWSAPETRNSAEDGSDPETVSSETEQAPASEGADAADTECVDDAKVIARRAVDELGLLELLQSPSCDTYWARATRTDDGFGQRIEVTVQNLRDRTQVQTAVEYDVNSAYTLMLERDNDTDRMCATGFIYLEETRRSLGDPLC